MDVKRFEEFVFERMRESRFPGMSVAAVRGEEILYSRGFGMADVEKGVAARAETMYPVASITKSFAAIAILLLQEEGKLSVEDEVGKYVEFPPVEGTGEKVRLRHLLTHTSGITALAYAEGVIGAMQGIGDSVLPIGGPGDIPMFMRGGEEWVGAGVGERWFYSNEGYVLLGMVVEKVSGKGFGEFVRERILRPLGMRRSGFGEGEVLGMGEMSVPYLVEGGQATRAGRQFFNVFLAEGGLYSNVLDLGRYVSMFLREGRPVMSGGSYREMVKKRVKLPSQAERGLLGEKAGMEWGYGYGLVVRDCFGELMLGHGGSLTLSTGYFAFLPGRGAGVAILGNSDASSMTGLAQLGLACLMGRDPLELDFLRVERGLKEVCGVYEGFRGIMRAEIRREGDFLRLQYVSRNPRRGAVVLAPVRVVGEERVFCTYSEGVRVEVEFRRRAGVWEVLHERYLMRRVGGV